MLELDVSKISSFWVIPGRFLGENRKRFRRVAAHPQCGPQKIAASSC
jgi:hypothetical protein